MNNFSLEFVPVTTNVDPCKHCFFAKRNDALEQEDDDPCSMSDLELTTTKDLHCHPGEGKRTDGQKGYWRLKLQAGGVP